MWQQRVEKHIRDRGLNQERFAESIGESQAWLSHKMTGRRKVTINDLQKIAGGMKIPVSDLISNDAKVVQRNEVEELVRASSTEDLRELLDDMDKLSVEQVSTIKTLVKTLLTHSPK